MPSESRRSATVLPVLPVIGSVVRTTARPGGPDGHYYTIDFQIKGLLTAAINLRRMSQS
jgi:hypothetical protein